MTRFPAGLPGCDLCNVAGMPVLIAGSHYRNGFVPVGSLAWAGCDESWARMADSRAVSGAGCQFAEEFAAQFRAVSLMHGHGAISCEVACGAEPGVPG